MSKKVLTDLNMNQNELQNAVIQNLASAPANPVAGQHYFNTTDNTEYVYNGTQWVDALNQGEVLTFNSPLSKSGTTVSLNLQASDIPDLSATYVTQSEVGANGGVASLDSTGKVPTSQLPSFVDDVVDAYIVSGATPLSAGWLSATSGGSALTPETDKIYVIVESGSAYENKTYRWSGSTYVEISPSPGAASESAAGIIEIATQAEVNTGTDDARAVTPLKLATYTSGMAKKATFTNAALTASSGVCTWTITSALSPDCICSIRETSGGAEVMCDVTYGSGSITVKINSSSNIASGIYTATVIG